MRHKKIIIGLGLTIVALGVCWVYTSHLNKPNKSVTKMGYISKKPPLAKKIRAQQSGIKRNLPLEDDSDALSDLIIPSQDVIRKGTAQDPHAIPESISTFSIALARELKLAKDSKEKATKLMNTLKTCMSQKNTSTIHYLCFRNARILARYYEIEKKDASLMRIYNQIESESENSVVSRMRVVEE